jgi:hypothetical protein
MATTKEKPEETFEGHGEGAKWPTVKKGTFLAVGTPVEMQSKAFSPNVKNGKASGDEV